MLVLSRSREALIAVWVLLTRRRLWMALAVITGCVLLAAIIVAHPAELLRQQIPRISLMHGWVPATVQAITVAVLISAIGWRSRRWRMWWLPVLLAFGVTLAACTHWYVASVGVAGDPAPKGLWVWIALSGVAGGIVVAGWRGAQWWRRGTSLLAVPLCLLSAGLSVNLWVGYFPTVHTAWNQLTSGPLPDQTDRTTVAAMQRTGVVPARGVVVPVTISGDASKFKHRGELVYLPPVWFTSNPPPRLPVAMLIGAEFNTPSDWVRAGNAISTADDFAAAHGGSAPVLVFADSGGAFNIDTECVNGTRGNAADHLTKDIVPFMISNFGVSPERADWGVAGFSSGGTCAVDLTVMHPELFSAFVDIAGDMAPNAGTKTQTVARLFGGSADAWAAFDPATVMSRHGPYVGVSGWFAVTAGAGSPESQDVAANTLCALGSTQRISCAVVTGPGKHDWSFGAAALAAAFPWFAAQLGTPGVSEVPLPAHSPPSALAQAAGPAEPWCHAQSAPSPSGVC